MLPVAAEGTGLMPTIEAQHELLFGAFPLVAADPSDLPYTVKTYADGASFGSPEPKMVEIKSMLLDGSLARILNYENRSMPFQVEISGPTLDDVALGEAALMVEVRKGRNELKWLPPDEMAATSVFDIVWSRLDFTFDDKGEKRRKRVFALTFTAAPFARDDYETEVEALGTGGTPPTPSTATVDACTATTGWSLVTDPASGPGVVVTPVAVVDGGVQGELATPGATTEASVTLRRSGLSATMTTTPYLVVTLRTVSVWALASRVFTINGVVAAPVAVAGSVFYFDCSAITTLAEFTVTSSHTRTRLSGSIALNVLDISRTNVDPFIGSGRQLIRAFTVGGSARTTGSIQLEHETDALGQVLVYTNSDDGSGYQPPSRQERVDGGAVTVDAATASGARSPLNGVTPETYDRAARTLTPGVYAVVARLRGFGGFSGLAGVFWRAYTRVGSTNHGQVSNSLNDGLITVDDTDWGIYSLGTALLPPVALPPGSDSFIRLDLRSTQAVEVDDMWLFNLTTGALTWVDCGTGTPAAGGASNRLWVDTASLDWPRPAVWVGTEADRSDARHAVGNEILSPGTHLLEPGVVNLFTYSNAANVAASARYARRHQFHATLPES